MEKKIIKNIASEYLKEFPNEKEKVEKLSKFLKANNKHAMVDWNNPKGHLTAGGFLYCTTTKKFLVMFHKDLKIYSYAGGHCEEGDTNPLERAIIELKEETGVQNFSLISKNPNKHIPFDIDIHFIEYNPRVNMAEHYHYDFRYLFVVDNEFDVKIDEEEMSSYKWIGKNELSKDVNFGKIVEKIEPLLKTVK